MIKQGRHLLCLLPGQPVNRLKFTALEKPSDAAKPCLQHIAQPEWRGCPWYGFGAAHRHSRRRRKVQVLARREGAGKLIRVGVSFRLHLIYHSATAINHVATSCSDASHHDRKRKLSRKTGLRVGWHPTETTCAKWLGMTP